MQVKTYGIHGLTEWHGKVRAGSIEVLVSFTGGTASPSGAQPAYMVTKDPITQFVIENSKEFKNGFIHLEMSQELPGEHPRMAVPKSVEKPKEPENAPAIKEYPEVTKTQEAKAVLLNEYGYNVEGIRSKAAAHEAAKELGISFPNLQA